MADTQDSPGSNLFFKGTDGNECEAFVVAIRDLAFANGKEEDCHWMLHYATTRLRGKALRWHAKLDPSVRKDWDLFVQALFEEYPFVKDSVDDEIATPVWSSTTLTLTPPAIGSLLNDVPPHSADYMLVDFESFLMEEVLPLYTSGAALLKLKNAPQISRDFRAMK
ncbi:hypothetical protein FRC01_009934, partial [Tulasnella sp. 417]